MEASEQKSQAKEIALTTNTNAFRKHIAILTEKISAIIKAKMSTAVLLWSDC
ncbi:hypothetical protein ACFL14_01225 [Patescibacteria group bacterium]